MWLDMVINVKKNLAACALAPETIIQAVIRVMVANYTVVKRDPVLGHLHCTKSTV